MPSPMGSIGHMRLRGRIFCTSGADPETGLSVKTLRGEVRRANKESGGGEILFASAVVCS